MAIGVEYGGKFTLTGPDGTVAVFNESSDPNYVGILSPESSGLDSPDVREDAQDRTEDDGGIHGNFYYGRRPVVLQGTIIASSATQRNERIDKLRRASRALRSDATLTWTPQGSSEEIKLSLRRQQPLRITKGYVKEFQLALVSASALIQSATLKTASANGTEGANGPTGANVPHTAGQLADATGTGGEWENLLTNIATSNNFYAKVVGGGGGHSKTGWLGNFEFNVPASATINGVEVSIERHGSTVKDNVMILYENNGTGQLGSNQASSETWPGTDATKVYGGSKNTWGATLTPAIVNSSKFSVGMRVTAATGSEYTAEIDQLTMKIYYEKPAIVVSVENKGDAEAPPVINITGPGETFTIKNATTGESIKVNYALAAGHVMEIDFQNRTIKDNGINIYSKLEFPGSSWWKLAPGVNKIETTVAASETTATKIEAQWRNAWS